MSGFDQWLVAGWRQSWSWFSIHMHMISTAMLGIAFLAPQMPDQVQAIIPFHWRALALGVWTILGLAARLAKQGTS